MWNLSVGFMQFLSKWRDLFRFYKRVTFGTKSFCSPFLLLPNSPVVAFGLFNYYKFLISLNKAVTIGVSCFPYFVSMQIDYKTDVNYQYGHKMAKINTSKCQWVLHVDFTEEGSERPSACFQFRKVYTGCFTTLGHNCRRWFPRSLWSKKFI